MPLVISCFLRLHFCCQFLLLQHLCLHLNPSQLFLPFAINFRSTRLFLLPFECIQMVLFGFFFHALDVLVHEFHDIKGRHTRKLCIVCSLVVPFRKHVLRQQSVHLIGLQDVTDLCDGIGGCAVLNRVRVGCTRQNLFHACKQSQDVRFLFLSQRVSMLAQQLAQRFKPHLRYRDGCFARRKQRKVEVHPNHHKRLRWQR